MRQDIAIEDLFEDVISKARAGLGISLDDLAKKSGVSRSRIEAMESGTFEEAGARAIASHLNLDADALVQLGIGEWRPQPVDLPGLAQFNTPYPVPGYQEMTVNAYVVWDPATKDAVVFDTGADATGICDLIREEGLRVHGLFLTHTHGDHVADIGAVKRTVPDVPVYTNRREPVTGAKLIEGNETFTQGTLSLEARLTHGHSPGGTTYVVSGLARTVAIVGDSLFCCSQGGAPTAFEQALRNNREKILVLPDDTVICPGHGPMTTVAEEKRANPFFAG